MVGAGTGVVSMVLAALRSANLASAAHDTCILSTDLRESLPSRSNLLRPTSLESFLVASSMELMSYNIHANSTLYPHFPPTVLPLDWDQELPESVLNIRERGGFDLIA
jgi:hypothetical protein